MMAPRDLISGSVFAKSTPTKDDIISDLQSELRRTQAQLVDEQRKRAMAEADAARLRRNARLVSELAIPSGDLEHGYKCPNCFTEVYFPEEQDYCAGCGTHFDWRTWADEDESAFDRRFDR